MTTDPEVLQTLRSLLATPSLEGSRELESQLQRARCPSQVLGRINQMASTKAATESPRGLVERITNAFDASLTAARQLAGVDSSDPALTPRRAVQRFLNPELGVSEWAPQLSTITFEMPEVQLWLEKKDVSRRFKRYQGDTGLCTVLVRDTSLGIARDDMPRTILALNSDSKLQMWEAIGQFGHGGSSALDFCESCLVVTQPRFGVVADEFYWTLIFPERSAGPSKQPYILKWFSSEDGLPLTGRLADFPELARSLPGTSLWHFGYERGDWAKSAVGAHQDTPLARLGRLLFSYPLPFRLKGDLARRDDSDRARTIRGAYYRLFSDDRVYKTGEKSETLIVDGVEYGRFSLFAFVVQGDAEVRNYVDKEHSVILTLHGQNHGEFTASLFSEAGFTELKSSLIAEIRLDQLDREALSEIINNARDSFRKTPFTKELRARVVELLRNDEKLVELERKRQEERARQSSADLSERMTNFLSSIVSDAAVLPGTAPGRNSPGVQEPTTPTRQLRPECPPAEPPQILRFLGDAPIFVPEGAARLVKFMSDARPPRYSFHGDNPRCFARLEVDGQFAGRLLLSGKADIDQRGYGSITLTSVASVESPVVSELAVGTLVVSLQATDGRTLEARLPIGLRPALETKHRKRQPSVKLEIRFFAPENESIDELNRLLGEDSIISGFGKSSLIQYRDTLEVHETECAYWGAKTDLEGISKLIVEINAAHPQLQRLLRSCKTIEEALRTKERIVQDIVLDCYQHQFKLEELPSAVHDELDDPALEDRRRAVEICLNFDKALRIALLERVRAERAKG